MVLSARLPFKLPANVVSKRIIHYPCRPFSVNLPTRDGSYYLTTPIFYPNSVPHIGHLYTLVTGDILARHARLTRPDRPVHFLAGTDEHGFKIQKAAQERNLEPLTFVDELSAHFRNLAERTDTSHTRFIRTTERDHYDAVQHVWRDLDSKGLIYKGTHQGWYSVSDECFYPDSQVSRVKSPRHDAEITVSTETGSAVEWAEEENYKFRLSAFRESLLARYESDKNIVYPPQQHANVLGMLSLPLEDLSISRPRTRLHWGIPVPNDPEHTMYVWFDALTIYLTGAGYPWKTAEERTLTHWPPNVQVIGKDILRFHAIYFPAMLQALNLPLPRRLLAHSHWTVNRQKMSKSVGNVADPFQAMNHLGVDLVRYYLARVGGRFKDDVDWSPEQLEKHALELQSLLGNFYLRITAAAIRKRLPNDIDTQTLLPELHEVPELNADVVALQNLSLIVDEHLQAFQVTEALEHIIHQLRAANQMLTVTEPWAKSTPPGLTQQVYALSLETLRVCGILLQPFIPSKAEELLNALGAPASMRTWRHGRYAGGAVGDVLPGVKLFVRPPRPS
ncbi:hypothetical protein FA95DRAFT_484434 [Auriscalpium vulgare]|uniref:Uncharacterized protein n=1 Tax=Auriscalpium vulgare TaxID=40419 RepID=A0ACB8SBF0_9AGAM|nr:hypothetical protein FA95DRAFT_484434 [Auriscalpium vulgare]